MTAAASSFTTVPGNRVNDARLVTVRLFTTYGEPCGPHTVSWVMLPCPTCVGPGEVTTCTDGVGFTAAGGATGAGGFAADAGRIANNGNGKPAKTPICTASDAQTAAANQRRDRTTRRPPHRLPAHRACRTISHDQPPPNPEIGRAHV